MPNCDWGRPCECSECVVPRPTPICNKCGFDADPSLIKMSHEYYLDRKGIGTYGWRGICAECSGEQEKAHARRQAMLDELKVCTHEYVYASQHRDVVKRLKDTGGLHECGYGRSQRRYRFCIKCAHMYISYHFAKK